ncbi:matrixin family metalloprotease [Limosilactobacillus kribbianus]|uniref:matrixin family metalloprotease n=1 Tax=Limosilactobacillus kribbianus TaxID=2982695 RepID=UPI00226444C4
MRRLVLICFITIWGFFLALPASADQLPTTPFSDSSATTTNQSGLTFSSSTTQKRHHYVIPQNTPVPLEGVRWPSKQVTICMQTDDPHIQQAFRDAVKRWNRTKAIRFRWIKNPNKAEVIAQTGDLDDSQSATVGIVTSQLGATETEFNPDTHTLTRATSTLDSAELDYTSRQFRSRVAQHELGHAIGLAHAPSYAHSVMIPRNIQTGITKNDIKSVRMLYHD